MASASLLTTEVDTQLISCEEFFRGTLWKTTAGILIFGYSTNIALSR